MSYQTLLLCCNGWEARIAPAYGANLLSLRYNGQDILRPWSEEITDPYVIGAPLLFPANRTAGGRFSFRNKAYTLPVNDSFGNSHLHGLLFRQTFRVETVEPDRICLSYENRGEIYPFPFRFTVCYNVDSTDFVSEYRIENPSETAMPFTFGLHTTFPEPDIFSVPLESCQEKDSHHIPTGRYIPLNGQEQQYVTGSASRDVVISGYYRAGGDTARIGSLRYRVTGFDHWILYNGRGQGGFLCVEPQLGGVNALNQPETCPTLEGHSAITLTTRLSVLP